MIHVDVNARLHDEARVVSANFDLELKKPGDAEKLISCMVAGMEETNRWAERNNVFIGHVKGFVTWGEDKAVMISTVGEDVQVKGSEERPEPPCTVKVGTTNIVFGIDLHEVEERVEEFVKEVVGQFDENAEICCEHDDGCECGCHDHDHDHEHEHEHHHHHHEHDDGCECGCHEHEHEHHHHHHEHDDGCGCGCHDHEHECSDRT